MEDLSIEQGVRESAEYRFERDPFAGRGGKTYWHVFRRRADCFVHCGIVHAPFSATVGALSKRWHEREEGE